MQIYIIYLHPETQIAIPAFIGRASKIVITIDAPIDLPHNTPVLIQTNTSTRIEGYVDRFWPNRGPYEGGSRNPCSESRKLLPKIQYSRKTSCCRSILRSWSKLVNNPEEVQNVNL